MGIEKSQSYRKVLGVSYEGYERAITILVGDIEARHLHRKSAMTGVQKWSRELKRLASSINYAVRAPRVENGKGQLRGGAVSVD